MNVAVNARVLLKHRMEGVCRYIYETTRRMVLAHPEHTFYFYFDRKYDPSFVFADNVIPVVSYPQARHPILWHVWFEYTLPFYFKKHKIDVFYSGDTYLSLRTDVPTLLVSHDIAYAHFPDHIPRGVLAYYRKNFPRFHRAASRIITVSQTTKDDVVAQYDLDPSTVSVAYNACPGGFNPKEEQEIIEIRNKYTDGKPFFVYVGSFHPRKNIPNLLKAFEVYKSKHKNDVQLVLIGRWAWNNEELSEIYNNHVFKEDIILLGSLFEEVKDIVPASIGLVYISLFEGFGIPILEGWSSGVPVITSNVSSMAEVAQEAAVTVNPTDVRDIAQALHRIATDEKMREEYISKGFDRLKAFNWDESSRIIWRALEECVSRAD